MRSVVPGAVVALAAYSSPYHRVRLRNVIIQGVGGAKIMSGNLLSRIIVESILVT